MFIVSDNGIGAPTIQSLTADFSIPIDVAIIGKTQNGRKWSAILFRSMN